MSHLSYIVETNGENGVRVEYHQISYYPSSVVNWVNGVNSFGGSVPLPDASLPDAEEYVRKWDGLDDYNYFRRTIVMSPVSATFLFSVLVDGSENNGGFVYDSFTSFFTIVRKGTFLEVTSRTNLGGSERDGLLTVTSNQYGDVMEVPIIQEYTPIRVGLVSYESSGLGGDSSGVIHTPLSFTHTFHWLTDKTSLDSESLSVEVMATGPRNSYIIRDISKYVYDGYLDDRCVYSDETHKYYRLNQRCMNGGLETVYEEVIFDTNVQAVYTKTKYENDLRIMKAGNIINVKNFGRCFMEDDAYYVITLSNVDDLDDTAAIIIRYETDDTATYGRGGDEFINPSMYMENGYVMMHTDNESHADRHFD